MKKNDTINHFQPQSPTFLHKIEKKAINSLKSTQKWGKKGLSIKKLVGESGSTCYD